MGRTNSQLSGGGDMDYFLLSTNPLAFTNVTMPDKYKTLEVTLPSAQTSLYQFAKYIKNCEHITINTSGTITNLAQLLTNTTSVKTLTLNFSTASVTAAGSMLSSDRGTSLEEITTPLDWSSMGDTDQYVWYGMNKLFNLTFVAGTIHSNLNLAPCSALNDNSLASIVNGLADLTGGTGKTLTLHATPKANLTAEQIATITAKNWTLA
jgi:hypothetical protein